ncbi:MAG: hypothetical protein EOO41_00705, partial [Methanobacteriota archaeon]
MASRAVLAAGCLLACATLATAHGERPRHDIMLSPLEEGEQQQQQQQQSSGDEAAIDASHQAWQRELTTTVDPTYKVLTRVCNRTSECDDMTAYSASATSAIGVSSSTSSTCAFSSLATAILQNSTATGWTQPLAANYFKLSARWSTSYATQTSTLPYVRLYKSTPAGCHIRKGMTPLCSIDLTQPVGLPVDIPLPSTISSSFSIMLPSLEGKQWL